VGLSEEVKTRQEQLSSLRQQMDALQVKGRPVSLSCTYMTGFHAGIASSILCTYVIGDYLRGVRGWG